MVTASPSQAMYRELKARDWRNERHVPLCCSRLLMPSFLLSLTQPPVRFKKWLAIRFAHSDVDVNISIHTDIRLRELCMRPGSFKAQMAQQGERRCCAEFIAFGIAGLGASARMNIPIPRRRDHQ